MSRIFLLIAFFLSSCSYIKSHPDSPAEEVIEEVIKKTTGLDVDLSSEETQKDENQEGK